ncbi:hypothetical protein Bhz59_00071 [Stenotrophomonas phage vB_SmaS_Bhz59]
MILRDLIKELQDLAEMHGDYLEVKTHSEMSRNHDFREPVKLVYFTYNDDESEAWITIE